MIDQIILSTNEDETYVNFWPHVAWAYRKIFPLVKLRLAFLTNKDYSDPLVKEFQKYGEVTLFPIHPHIPEFAQAKMIRYVLAADQGTDICYIDDVDLFPLRRDFITDKTDKRPAGHLLCVGGEVYHNIGSYPVSQMTAEGHVWHKFINPQGLGWPDIMGTYMGEVMFDRRENPLIELDFAIDDYFSDERLIRRLLHYNPVPKFEVERGYTDFLEATIDRATWDYSVEKLMNHGYVNAHCGRPYDEEDFIDIKNYIKKYY